MKKIIITILSLAPLILFGQTIPISVGISDSLHYVRIANSILGFPSPTAGTLLQLINNGIANGRIENLSYYNNGIQGSAFTGKRARGSVDSPLPPQAGDILSVLNGMGYGIDSFPNLSSGSVTIRAESAFTNTSKPTAVSILTAPAGSVLNVERVRVASTGLLSFLAYNSVGILQTDGLGNVSTALLTSGQLTTALGYTPYNGTTNPNNYITSASVTGKLNVSDTSAMLLPYLRKSDTTAMLSAYIRTATANASIALKLSISDTSAMLSTYLRSAIAAATYATISNVALKLNISDTSGMLSTYFRTANFTGSFNNVLATKTTDNLTQGATNKYYTDALARASVSAGTGISYNISTGAITNSAPDQTVVLTGANNFAVTGTYPSFTLTQYIPAITSAVTRPINSTTFTVSTTKQAYVAYNVNISCTATIGSAASGSIALQYSTNAGSTWVTVGTVSNSNTVTLALTLNSVQVSGLQVSGFIPANALVRMVPTSAGTTTITFLTGQETF